MTTMSEGNVRVHIEEEVGRVDTDPSYRAWLRTNPAPGEVFVDTGEASAADARKLRWSPSTEQRELIKSALSHEVDFINELYKNGEQSSYADHIETLVGDTLRGIGVDPATLKPLPGQS